MDIIETRGQQLQKLFNRNSKTVYLQNGKILENCSINELKDEVSDSVYIFEVDKLDKINKVIDKKIEKIDDKTFTIKTDRDSIPNIVKSLVDNDYKVYHVSKYNISLEDAFLEKVGGNTIE